MTTIDATPEMTPLAEVVPWGADISNASVFGGVAHVTASNRNKGKSGSNPCRGNKARGDMLSQARLSPSEGTPPRRPPGEHLAYGKWASDP